MTLTGSDKAVFPSRLTREEREWIDARRKRQLELAAAAQPQTTTTTSTTTDVINIVDRGSRARYQYEIHVHTYHDLPNGDRVKVDEQTNQAFNSRGDAESFALELERRLVENLGHRVERR